MESFPNKKILPWLVAIAFFMESLDTTILNTAAPVIAKAMEIAPLNMKAALACYTLSLALFIPISGWMADRYGTRRVFSWAISVFILSSFLCGISQNIYALVTFRFLQGCGGAMMLPVGRITIARSFPKTELIRAFSFVVIPGLTGPMLGPVLGGLIAGYWHWRFIFFVNIPIGLIGLYFVHQHLPDYRKTDIPAPDILGLIFFGSGICLLSYVLEVFGEHSLNSIEIILLVVIAALQFAGYLRFSKRKLHPLLRLELFGLRTFFIAVTGGFLVRLSMAGIPFLLPLLYQVGFGYTPIQSGLLMLPQATAAIGLKMLMPKILNTLGYRNVLILNTVGIALTILSFSWIGINTPLWHIVLIFFFYGFLSSLEHTTLNTLVYADISEEQTSGAATIASTFQQLSFSYGIATASIITSLFLPDHIHLSATTFIQGIHSAFITLGVLALLSSCVFWALNKNDGAAFTR